ncbi:ROK family protein [Rhizobium sp. P32RR-XVIII]|uniref:ROK family protein n=1 Tax=Rhizobium sp. P32RR-XVIII TaxID=2726738 RepID=UPI0028B234F8|nr:ROK family protein [Rhizobium sp. P32RR-XVIII]
MAGVDLGGTKVLAGLADLQGRVLATVEEPTEHGAGAPVLKQIPRMVLSLLKRHHDRGPLHKAVIGIPSAVSPSTGLASLSPHLAVPADQPLAALLARSLPCPVVVENDVNLAAFAEATLGKGRNLGSLAFIAFGTGVGMGLVIGGRLFRGHHGRAGELGLLPLGADPHRTAPRARAGLFEDQVDSPAVRSLYGDGRWPVSEIFAHAAKGDAEASGVIETLARSASVGIASVQTIFDPALIVLGGGIGSRKEFVDAVTRHMSALLPFAARIEATGIGREAGMVGALMLGLSELSTFEAIGEQEIAQ